jgi:hypothetical protein
MNLNRVDRLLSIGYGLADADINEILQDWLAASGHRRLEVVCPHSPALPAALQPLSSQVEFTASSTTTYLERFT